MPDLETLLAHAGCQPDPATGAVVAPIHMSTTFERAPDGTLPHGYLYSRIDNPTRRDLEETLARLEGGAEGAAFASGLAASAAILQALRPGDHVILPDDLYYGVRQLATEVFAEWGLAWTAVDLTDLDALRAAVRPETRLVWAETPSNPLLKVTDLAAVGAVAREVGALFAVDATWCTPLVLRPIDLGADLVVHSATKYLAGHSDVLGGVVVAREAEGIFARIRRVQTTGGGVMDPFSAWLTLRGLRSLGARLRLHVSNAAHVARFLADHPRVTRVYYPGLETHPGHDVARAQMKAFGGMLSFEVEGGAEGARAVAGGVRLITRATSLGGTESLIEHRAAVEAPPTQTPPSLLRLSVGLEAVDDLVEDLSRALGR